MPGEIRIVLVATRHAGNLGASARAMKVMGLERLILVAPRCRIDPEARARAAGARDVLQRAQIVATIGEALHGVRYVAGTSARRRRLGPEESGLRAAMPRLLHERGQGDVAILFGSERFGLANDALECCNQLWRIPTVPGYGSLNLAAAVQVVAYEIFASGDPGPVAATEAPAACVEEVAALCAHFDRAAGSIGYVDPDAPRLALRRVRRLARRARLEHAEVKLLHGFLNAAEARSGRLRP